MGAGASSPRRGSTSSSPAGSSSTNNHRQGRRRSGSPSGRRRSRRRDAPPQAAVTAAQSRGDVVTFTGGAGQQISMCLCKPRRLEYILEGQWVRAIENISASLDPDGIDLCTDNGEVLTDLPQRDSGLLRILGGLARLATRASVPHDLWRDVREAGIEVAHTNTDSCYYCSRPLATAPAFCTVTGRLHPVPPFQGWEPVPPEEALSAAEEREDFVIFENEMGVEHKLVFVNVGRLEKFVAGEWKRPITRLEVPHVGARTLRDYHVAAPAGCMLKADGIKDLLAEIAVLADRAAVDHNLWEHSSPPALCRDCRKPLHLAPVCPETNQPHVATSVESPASTQVRSPIPNNLNDNGSLRVRRRLSGPSEHPTTPQVTPLSPTSPLPVEGGNGSPPALLPPSVSDQTNCNQNNNLNLTLETVEGDEQHDQDHVDHVHGIVSEECCVCLEEPKNTVLMPCRHLCVCSGCAQILTQCPLCRFVVVHRFEVF
eukprot:TRINITY_DN2843_c2_g1_i1.p1 TRINITY_DN2843_c2_g1~~TRINITY_DN2843_c2_g1_i1.p1  ORF type:complete len:485 (+),score=102.53 TRINITY_DN2843_c2_g1_i1:76-1530(+)